jgi:predicted transcriptional regulator
MDRNTSDNHNPADLGDLEREVLQLIWQGSGQVTADSVREALPRKPKDSTVRTVLKRLEEKGYLTHEVEGRTFLYQAAEPPTQVAARAVKKIVEWFCNGSVSDVLVGMVDAEMLDPDELKQLAAKLEQARKSQK